MNKNKDYNEKHTNTLLIIFLSLIVMSAFSCKQNESDSKQANDLIESIEKSLPQGTTSSEVESYLNKSNIEYSYDDETKSFIGIIRDVKQNGMVSENISLTIKMDVDGKLKSIDAKTVHTGP